jgi:aryl-alcohol dehydrogenase-like predicted oxidoreductase
MTTNRYQVLREVNDRQRLAIEALLTGATHAEAAEKAGVHRVTVSSWATKHPGFQAELNRRRREVRERSASRLRELDVAALDAVATQLETHDPEFAMKWLKFRGANATTFPDTGPTDAEEILERLVAARVSATPTPLTKTVELLDGVDRNRIRNELEAELLAEFVAEEPTDLRR